MPARQLAERLPDVDARLRGTERHIREQLDEAVTNVRHLDPNGPTGRVGHRVEGAPEATGEISDETNDHVVSAGQREMDSHDAESNLRLRAARASNGHLALI